MTRISILNEILSERDKQFDIHHEHGIDINEFDKTNSRNDWISYITTYAGRASDKVFSNKQNEFRKNLIKVGALVVAAIESYDKGYCG